MKKYTLEQLKNDPKTKGRWTWAVINCLEKGITDIEEIFTVIDEAYKTGKHISPSEIRDYKKKAAKLIDLIDLTTPSQVTKEGE